MTKGKEKRISIGFCITLCFTFLCLIPSYLYSQDLSSVISKTEEINRLNEELRNADDDTSRYFVHQEMYYLYINDDTELALETAKQALRYAQLANLDDRIALTYLYLGYTYLIRAEFDNALENLSIGIQLSQEHGPDYISRLMSFNLGITYLELHIYDLAEKYLEDARAGFVNNRNKSLPVYELFRVNIMQGDTSTALAYLNEFESYIPEENGQVNANYLFHYAVLSEAYVQVGSFDKAEQVVTRVTPFIQKHNRRYYRGIINITKSKIAQYKGDIDAAAQFAETALSFFELQKETFYQIKSLALLSDLYSAKNNYERSYQYLSRYKALQNNLLKARQSAIQNRLTDQLDETAKVESELGEIEGRLQDRKIYLIILIILLTISIALATWSYRLIKLRDQSLEEIARINDDKNHFIGVVSHDLRSPLNSIMALSSLLLDGYKDTPPKVLEEYSSIILTSSKRMENLISNMLDINKIENRQTKLVLEPISVSNIILEISESMKHLGNEKGIHTKIEVEDNLPNIMADLSAFERVLENLISNAYKFSQKNSTVLISGTTQGSQVQISIKDEGHGMTELDRSKLFKKFEKLSASPTGNEKSTGLGLYIVKNLMTEMNGTILVESELDKGTTFKVLFNKA